MLRGAGLPSLLFGTQSCAAKNDIAGDRRYSFDISSKRCSPPDAQPQPRGVWALRQGRSIAMPSPTGIEGLKPRMTSPLSI
jgi:hypothetical protein